MTEAPTTTMVAAAAAATTIPDREVADKDEDAEAAEEIIMAIRSFKNITCYNCDKKGHYSSDCKAPKKNGNENSNMVSKLDFKNLFQSSIKEMLTKREKHKNKKISTDMDEDSLDMNVCDMFTGKHSEIVSRHDDDDSMSITNNLFHFEQTNEPDKCYLKIIRRIIMMKLLTHLVKELN
jgi:hypothetical protein